MEQSRAIEVQIRNSGNEMKLPDAIKRSWKNVESALLYKLDNDSFLVTKAMPRGKLDVALVLDCEFPVYFKGKLMGKVSRECDIAPLKETLVAASMLAKEVTVTIERSAPSDGADALITSDLAALSRALGFRLDALGGRWKCIFAPVDRTLDELVSDSVRLVQDYVSRVSKLPRNDAAKFEKELKCIHADLSLTGEETMDRDYNDALRALALFHNPGARCAFQKMLLVKCCEAMLDELQRILEYATGALHDGNASAMLSAWHEITEKPLKTCLDAVGCYSPGGLDDKRRERLLEVLRYRKERFDIDAHIDRERSLDLTLGSALWMVGLLCERIVMLSGTSAATMLHFQRFP